MYRSLSPFLFFGAGDSFKVRKKILLNVYTNSMTEELKKKATAGCGGGGEDGQALLPWPLEMVGCWSLEVVLVVL